jgi:hypothetical protein
MTYRETTRKDAEGRVWSYCPLEGTWGHGPHLIKCRPWVVIWAGPNQGWREFRTLEAAMEVCGETVEQH